MIYTKISQEACGAMAPGLTCDVYEMYEKDNEEGKTKTWIDTSKHLSRKMEMGLQDNVVNTIIYTYGPVTITEPSPVKEFTMPTLPDGAGEGIPSQADLEKMMKELPNLPTDSSGE
jgi:outer membrane lipoprotein-sorting protein